MKTLLTILLSLISIVGFTQSADIVGHVDLVGHNQTTLKAYLESNDMKYSTTISSGYVDYYISNTTYYRVNISSKMVEGIVYSCSNKTEYKNITKEINVFYEPKGNFIIDDYPCKFITNKGGLAIYLTEVDLTDKGGYKLFLFFCVKRNLDFKNER